MRYFAFAAAFLGASSFLSAADSVLLNLIMPNAQVVAGVDLAKAKTSPFGQFVLRQMPADSDFTKFITTTGFDPRRDLQEVLMATAADHKSGMVVARGTFDVVKITTLANADGKVRVTTYNGAQLFLPLDPKQTQAFAIYDNSFAVAGDAVTVRAALDRRKTQNPLDPALLAKISMYGAADAWSVSMVPLSALGGNQPSTKPGPLSGILQGDLLKKVSETSGGVTFNSPVQVTGELIADSSQDATALGDVVKLLASMVQTNAGPAGAEVATLLQSLSVSTEGNKLKLALSIPEAQLEALIESGKQAGKTRKIEKI